MTQVAKGEQRNGLARERVRQMHANSGDVTNVTAARSEVSLIAVQSLRHAHRLPIISFAAAAGEGLRTILRLPEIQKAGTVRFLEIVGVRDSLCPVAALPVGHTYYPRAGGSIAPVAQGNAGGDFHEDWFLRDWQLQSRSPRL